MKNTLISILLLLFCALPVLGQGEDDLIWSRTVLPYNMVKALFTPDEQQIIVARKDTLMLLDAATGVTLKEFFTPDMTVAMDMSHDGKTLVLGKFHDSPTEWYTYFVLFDMETFDTLGSYNIGREIYDVAFSQDDNNLFLSNDTWMSSDDSGYLTKWNLNTKTEDTTILDDYRFRMIDLSPDGKYIVAGGRKGYPYGAVTLWDANTLEFVKELGIFEMDETSSFDVECVKFSPDNSMVARCDTHATKG